MVNQTHRMKSSAPVESLVFTVAAILSISMAAAHPLAILSKGRGILQLPKEVCAGYETQDWWNCPSGRTCLSTYRGSSGSGNYLPVYAGNEQIVSGCGTGDFQIGSQGDRAVCAVCSPACTSGAFQSFSTLATTPASASTVRPSAVYSGVNRVQATTWAINQTPTPQTVTMTFQFQQTLTTTFAWQKDFLFSERASVKIPIPSPLDSKPGDTSLSLEFSSSQTLTTAGSYTTTNTAQVQYTTPFMIAPFSKQQVIAIGTVSIIQLNIPVTINTTDTCGMTVTSQNTAIVTTSGILNSLTSAINVVYGVTKPVTPPVVLPQATVSCQTNLRCALAGLEGACCPTPNGVYLPCCSQCASQPSCAPYAFDSNVMCCPSATNITNSCCP